MKSLKKIILSVVSFTCGEVFAYNLIHRKKGFGLHPTVKTSELKISGHVLVGEGSKLLDGVKIMADSTLKIGRFTSINGPGTSIFCKVHNVEIGSFCSIARGVDIQEYNHAVSRPSTYYIQQNIFGNPKGDLTSKGPVSIGNDVWIGAQSIILSGVEIGHGAVVAANSVVTSHVPPYSIVAGSPAKVIGQRFSDDVIARLLKLEWWNWEISKIKRNKSFFDQDVTIESLSKISE